jgi:hypothetical protein
MNEKTTVTPTTGKIIWTQPVIQIINVNSARHGVTSVVNDAGKNHKS